MEPSRPRSQRGWTQGQLRRESVCSLFRYESKPKSEIIKEEEAVNDMFKTQRYIKKDIEVKRLFILDLDQKYMEIRKPICDERSEFIKKIPFFWKTVFMNHPKLKGFLTDLDIKIFANVTSINVGKHEEGEKGYSISFEFCTNDYIKNEKISKNYAVYKRKTVVSVSKKLRWKDIDDKNELIEVEKEVEKERKKQREKERKKERKRSFFDWFNITNELIHKSGDRDEFADIIKYEVWDDPGRYYYNDDDDQADDDQADDDQAGSSAQ